MRSRASVKPSQYPPIPFHTIRLFGLISTFIVGIILAVFINQLHSNNYKLPWAFLILLIATVFSLLNYILTTLTHCCYGLSPRLNLVTNSIVLVLWLIALGLLSWSMAHTILTTCNTTYWGTSTGISVCRIYKALFTFTIVAATSHIAAAALDVIVYRRQTRLGQYDPMASSTALNDYKMHNRDSSIMSGGVGPYPPDEADHPYYANHPHQEPLYQHAPEPLYHPSQRMPPPPAYGAGSLEQHHADEAEEYSDAAPVQGRRKPRVRFSAYGGTAGYSQPTEQTSYDPAAYR
ncbi:uncharacterized protein BO88DRAFT_446038 [Aspergillus vadensis CBS 113365]|uniref:MARVEL domain-containing protein n=1 Tax=Aspergillus vadensis (strain CBS 113365 / IMI 142717 / IBT 24658) TaxID=1448311 RepID=A0A319CAA2_ASPVC|nr:hypothetical protein BO88DRAFT_446038 [Aspergillus vadensis CBS 113365]PYH65582.1 hypothetical protein BO88DRAFT_446038 [Aspergillus vadensis CBS 113365]